MGEDRGIYQEEVLLLGQRAVLIIAENEKYEIYYEPIALFTTFGQLAGLMILILAIFAYFSFNLQMKEAFIAIGLCPTIFETYHSSIKGFISRRKSAKKEL